MKIAFYLDEVRDGIDYSNPELSNPGIGGTQFLIWELSYFMTKYSNNEIILFVPKNSNFNNEVKVIVIPNVLECISFCSKNYIDYLIIRGPYIPNDVVKKAEKEKVKLISWSHNFETYRNIKGPLNNNIVKKNICVSHEQLDLLLDTDIYIKSEYIYNGISFKDYDSISIKHKKNRIVYIGNLYPNSGYDKVARAWDKVKKEVPSAELIIIGGNNLYNVNKFNNFYSNATQKRLQQNIKKHLYEGNLPKKDVTFVGVLGGKEKLEIMASASVGIANLTDSGETFGLSALEFEALGVPVVSMSYGGTMESIKDNETGILAKSEKEIAEALIYILKNDKKREELANNAKSFSRKNFNIINLVLNWDKMIFNIENPKEENIDKTRFTYNKKIFVYLNYKIRKIFSFIPPVAFYKYLRYCFFRLLSKLNMI